MHAVSRDLTSHWTLTRRKPLMCGSTKGDPVAPRLVLPGEDPEGSDPTPLLLPSSKPPVPGLAAMWTDLTLFPAIVTPGKWFPFPFFC